MLLNNEGTRCPIIKNIYWQFTWDIRQYVTILSFSCYGQIIGFAHSYWNQKVIENYFKIPLVVHSLFRFNFFFLLKWLRSGVWKTMDVKIGVKNHTDINFASIGNQVQFIDTVKYFQQSLSGLANNLTNKGNSAISRECERFLRTDSQFLLSMQEEKQGLLNYLLSGKGTIPYKLITEYDSFDIVPGNGDFFLPHNFYSSLKDTVLSDEEYENVKKFYKTMKLINLGELSKIYKFQGTIILCEICE